MARTARGEIIFFSLDEENPVVRDHVRERGKAVVLRPTRHGEMITLIEHRRDTSLLLAEQIPATFEGRVRVNVANALAAAAAAFAADVGLEHIRHALRTFTSSFFQTPGRFNLLEVDGRRVLMDYCHNVAGLEAMADFVKRMDADRTIAMISMPGDRADDDIHAFGRLAGATFQEIVIREDANTRGRPSGEIAGMLGAAVAEAGLPADRTTVVLDEIEAAHATVARAGRNDLVVLLVDRPTLVWESLTSKGGASGNGRARP
jgi:cyanophycin synthetase